MVTISLHEIEFHWNVGFYLENDEARFLLCRDAISQHNNHFSNMYAQILKAATIWCKAHLHSPPTILHFFHQNPCLRISNCNEFNNYTPMVQTCFTQISYFIILAYHPSPSLHISLITWMIWKMVKYDG